MTGASALDIRRFRDPAEFEEDVNDFLCLREAENNLILGLVSGLKARRRFGLVAPYFVVFRDEGDVIGAAMRTPPLNLLFAAGTKKRAIRTILLDHEETLGALPGLSGPQDVAVVAARDWARRSGQQARLHMASRIYRLTRVRSAQPPNGAMRRATPADRDLISSWFRAFFAESRAGHGEAGSDPGREYADYWIGSGGLRVWDDGEPVAMAGAGGPTPNGIRVSAVFTPAEKRRRGYASALVAALSQEQLDAGRRFCFLFTDLANQTANHIYQDIGYEPVSDVQEWRFES